MNGNQCGDAYAKRRDLCPDASASGIVLGSFQCVGNRLNNREGFAEVIKDVIQIGVEISRRWKRRLAGASRISRA